MNIKGKLYTKNSHCAVDCTLTTERAESSYGLPVLVLEGIAYGPADIGRQVLEIDSGFVTVAVKEADLQAARAAGYNVRDDVARFYGLAPRWEVNFNDLDDEI